MTKVIMKYAHQNQSKKNKRKLYDNVFNYII